MADPMRVVTIYASYTKFQNILPSGAEAILNGFLGRKLGGGMFLLNGNDFYEHEVCVPAGMGEAFLIALKASGFSYADHGIENDVDC